jgi:hypothetical protein
MKMSRGHAGQENGTDRLGHQSLRIEAGTKKGRRCDAPPSLNHLIQSGRQDLLKIPVDERKDLVALVGVACTPEIRVKLAFVRNSALPVLHERPMV